MIFRSNLRDAFEAFDEDGKGTIDEQELINVLEATMLN